MSRQGVQNGRQKANLKERRRVSSFEMGRELERSFEWESKEAEDFHVEKWMKCHYPLIENEGLGSFSKWERLGVGTLNNVDKE